MIAWIIWVWPAPLALLVVLAVKLSHHRPSHDELEKRIARREHELGMPQSTEYGRNTYRAIGATPTRTETATSIRKTVFAREAKAMNDDTLAKEVARHCSNQDYNDAMVAEAKRRADEAEAAALAKEQAEKMEHLFDISRPT